MATHVVNGVKLEQVNQCVPGADDLIGCSIGIMAYNEEANIEHTLQ